MRITIDTKSDSLEDIKRVVSLLQGFLGTTPSFSTPPSLLGSSGNEPAQTYSPMSIFADDVTPSFPPTSTSPVPTASPAQSSTSYDVFSMFNTSNSQTSSYNQPVPAQAPLGSQAWDSASLTSDDLLREAATMDNEPLPEPEEEPNPDDDSYRLIPY